MITVLLVDAAREIGARLAAEPPALLEDEHGHALREQLLGRDQTGEAAADDDGPARRSVRRGHDRFLCKVARYSSP